MKQLIYGTLIAVLCLASTSTASAGTVTGHAFKTGQTDHSNITIHLIKAPDVPAIGVTGAAILLGGLSLLLIHSRKKLCRNIGIILLVTGFVTAGIALSMFSTTTLPDGLFEFTDIPPGNYTLTASASGYTTPPSIPVKVMGSMTMVPDIFLNPIPPGDLFATDSIIGPVRFVPGGTFTQGSPVSEPFRWSDEDQFEHTLTRNIAVMETEVSRQMWHDLSLLQPGLPADPSDTLISPIFDHPVQNILFPETLLFANLVSIHNGYSPCYYFDSAMTIVLDSSNYLSGPWYCNFDNTGYRLPTEGEWEYFTRAGTTGTFSIDVPDYSLSTGGTCDPPPPLAALDTVAWWCGNSDTGSGHMAHPVASKATNPWNLYDVHGNVWEWCWDIWDDYPSSDATDHTGPDYPGPAGDRVMRSGGYHGDPRYCRAAQRMNITPTFADNGVGFRLVRTIP